MTGRPILLFYSQQKRAGRSKCDPKRIQPTTTFESGFEADSWCVLSLTQEGLQSLQARTRRALSLRATDRGFQILASGAHNQRQVRIGDSLSNMRFVWEMLSKAFYATLNVSFIQKFASQTFLCGLWPSTMKIHETMFSWLRYKLISIFWMISFRSLGRKIGDSLCFWCSNLLGACCYESKDTEKFIKGVWWIFLMNSLWSCAWQGPRNARTKSHPLPLDSTRAERQQRGTLSAH